MPAPDGHCAHSPQHERKTFGELLQIARQEIAGRTEDAERGIHARFSCPNLGSPNIAALPQSKSKHCPAANWIHREAGEVPKGPPLPAHRPNQPGNRS